MKVLAQGVSSISDIFNIITNSSTRLDSNVVKNMDDLAFYADSLEDLEKHVCEFSKIL